MKLSHPQLLTRFVHLVLVFCHPIPEILQRHPLSQTLLLVKHSQADCVYSFSDPVEIVVAAPESSL